MKPSLLIVPPVSSVRNGVVDNLCQSRQIQLGISFQLLTNSDLGLRSGLSVASLKTKFLASSAWLICGPQHNSLWWSSHLSRNFRFGPPSRASYASPAVQTMNLAPAGGLVLTGRSGISLAADKFYSHIP